MFFFLTDQAFTQIYTLSLHDALPIYRWIIMTSPRWVVAVEIPPTFGKRQFTYSWGSPWALFGAGPTTSEGRKSAGRNPRDAKSSYTDRRSKAKHPGPRIRTYAQKSSLSWCVYIS